MPAKEARIWAAKLLKDTFWCDGSWATTLWKGVPALKHPSDFWWYQEVLWETKPAFVIETGTWSGGSAMYFADTLRALGIDGQVITIDIAPKVKLDYPGVIQVIGNALDPVVLNRLRSTVGNAPVMVCLDDDHSRKHVAAEMEIYCEFVTPGQHFVIEDLMPFEIFVDGTYLVSQFVQRHPEFQKQHDRYPEGFTAGGWMKRE